MALNNFHLAGDRIVSFDKTLEQGQGKGKWKQHLRTELIFETKKEKYDRRTDNKMTGWLEDRRKERQNVKTGKKGKNLERQMKRRTEW